MDMKAKIKAGLVLRIIQNPCDLSYRFDILMENRIGQNQNSSIYMGLVLISSSSGKSDESK